MIPQHGIASAEGWIVKQITIANSFRKSPKAISDGTGLKPGSTPSYIYIYIYIYISAGPLVGHTAVKLLAVYCHCPLSNATVQYTVPLL